MDKKEELLEKILDKLDDITIGVSETGTDTEVVDCLRDIEDHLLKEIRPAIHYDHYAWEYLMEYNDVHPLDLDLNYKGREGWELVSIQFVKGQGIGVRGQYHTTYKRKTNKI